MRNELEMLNGGSAIHGITILSDLSQEEFEFNLLGYKESSNQKMAEIGVVKANVSETSLVDWAGCALLIYRAKIFIFDKLL